MIEARSTPLIFFITRRRNWLASEKNVPKRPPTAHLWQNATYIRYEVSYVVRPQKSRRSMMKASCKTPTYLCMIQQYCQYTRKKNAVPTPDAVACCIINFMIPMIRYFVPVCSSTTDCQREDTGHSQQLAVKKSDIYVTLKRPDTTQPAGRPWTDSMIWYKTLPYTSIEAKKRKQKEPVSPCVLPVTSLYIYIIQRWRQIGR